ncbi:MAG: Trk system potassium transporter TrkA [Lachnospiraceae bacterium]|nr:Trk system potassium transporter TrkA [Lachnospiraceae bacterium]
MNIIIVGCGKVGSTIAKQLCNEGYDVTVIDNNPNKLRAVSDGMDAMAMVGDGTSYTTLREAGIENADVLIAVTDSDEKNLLCCVIGKRTGNLAAIARVRNPVYSNERDFLQKGFGLAMLINPESAGAEEMGRIFRFPSAIDIETFAKGKIELLTVRIPEKSLLAGKPLTYIHQKLRTDVLVAVVRRKGQVIIPSGDFVIEAGDLVSVIAEHEQAHEFFRKIGIETHRVRDVLIIGGGKMTYYMAKNLAASGIGIKIIEKDLKRCEVLSELLPDAEIICGDGTDEDLLLEEGIEKVDGVAAVTGMDEQNIMLTLFARSQSDNVKTVTKVGKLSFTKVIDSLDLGSVVNPKETTAEYIIQFVRSMRASMGSNVENLYKIANGEAEAIEFHVTEKTRAVSIPLVKLNTKKNILIGKIFRNGRAFTPTGHDSIEVGDSVILVVLSKDKIRDLDDILAY